MTEEINPPIEAQPAEQPMMTFTQLEALADKEAEQQADQDKGSELGGQEQPPPAEGQVAEDPVAKVLAETGFKSIEELVKSQKEGHATITKLSQERAALQRDMDALAQFPKMLANQIKTQPRTQSEQPQGQPDSLTLELFKDMAPFVDALVEQRISERTPNLVEQKIAMKELGSKVAAKRAENPEEFDDLRPIMQSILTERPQYESHPDGLNVVYDMAKQVRDSRISKITSSIFGEDIPLDKFREAVKLVMSGQTAQPPPQQNVNVQQAAPSSYVPPSSANTPPMTQKPTNYDSEIASRMKGKITPDMVDEITDLAWQKALSKSQSQSDTRPRR